jgi:phage terminase large subunit
MPSLSLEFPEVMGDIVKPYRYKVFYGGRGSGKSWTVARYLIIRALQEKLTILCTREFQKSIQDSVLKLLSEQIDALGLDSFFEVQRTAIHGANGSYFLFEGLRHNVTKIKSMEGVDYCWIEEAEKVSSESWDVLIPTIRKPASEILITFNPDSEDDTTYQRFIVNPPEDSLVVKVNHSDNPWFPEVLRKEMAWMEKTDRDRYLHIWEGNPRSQSDAQVFKGKWTVESFDTPEGVRFHFGADWGFSQDPTTLVRCFIADRVLYIDYEVYAVGIDIVETPALFDLVPGAREWPIIADSARPETISHMSRAGFRIRGASKGKGSVEDGIAYLRSFERIMIHPRCKHTADEFRLYSYKVDRVSGDVLPLVEDSHNHIIDALRYALEPMMKASFTRSVSVSWG